MEHWSQGFSSQQISPHDNPTRIKVCFLVSKWQLYKNDDFRWRGEQFMKLDSKNLKGKILQKSDQNRKRTLIDKE